MNRNLFQLLFLSLIVCSACDSGSDASVPNVGSLFVEDVGYKLSQLIIHTNFNNDNPEVEIYLADESAKYKKDIAELTGKAVTSIMFEFQLAPGTTEIPMGTFVVGEHAELNGAVVYINLNTDTEEKDLVAVGLEAGTLVITKEDSRYNISFTGVIGNQNIHCSFNGKAKIYQAE